jgi:cellulose biosynthesis protein BcsQ
MTGVVFFAGAKGGVGKSATSHLACLGAVLRNQPAAYVLTDPNRRMRGEGRPYGVLDGREPQQLANILSVTRKGFGGWLIIDGGGNRPAFDLEVAAAADLCILPFRASEEDLDTVADDLRRIPNAVAWPTAWPTNPYASRAAQFLIEGLQKAFPLRLINSPIPFVNSVSELLSASLDAPSSPVRQLARKVFDVMSDEYDQRKTAAIEQPSEHAMSA